MQEGNKRAELAFNMYCKKITDYIAEYFVELVGADVIIFTAGVGENNSVARKKIIENLNVLGIELDEEKNNECHGTFDKITKDESKIPVYVVPTNEELMIARDAKRFASH